MVTPCGPDEERCDYSFTCSKHQEEIQQELDKQRHVEDQTEMLEILREMQTSLAIIAKYLQPLIDEERRKRLTAAMRG